MAVIVLRNLATAVMVENALMTSNFFLFLDEDGDGLLSGMEFKSAVSDPTTGNKWKLLDLYPEEFETCYDYDRMHGPGPYV